MKEILVTGGTGFIGIELVKHLCAAGFRPRVLVRRPHRASLLAPLDVDLIQGDLSSRAALERAVAGVDTVFHLGGRASFETYRRLKPTIVDGTVALAQASAAAGVERFVFASSLFVYGDQAEPINRQTRPLPQIDYGRAKIEAEGRITEIAQAADMRLAIMRLPHVYGPQSILFEQVRSGLAIFPGGMSNRCGQLHVEDAASALAAAGQTGWVGASAIADDEVVTWREFFDVLDAFNPDYRMIALPQWIGYSGAAFLEPLFSRKKRPTLYTKDTVVGFNLEVPVQPGLVWQELGIEPKYPSVRQGIPAVLDGYLRYRWRHPLMDRRRS
jgi:nucleoside-diphosphate-sugar epimerase